MFLSNELSRFNTLIGTISASLHALLRALRGEVAMSSEVEAVYSSLRAQSVPVAWTALGHPSLLSLPSWTENFLSRISFMQLWALQGKCPYVACHTMLYYAVLYYTVLCYSTPYYVMLQYAMSFYTILYYITLCACLTAPRLPVSPFRPFSL